LVRRPHPEKKILKPFRKAKRQTVDEMIATAAEAVEGAIIDHAVAIGDQVAPRLASARTQIAKTYAADKALGTEGNVNPQAYAKLLEKGRPLSGGALEVAEAAKQNPRSMQKPTGGNALSTRQRHRRTNRCRA